MADVMLPGMDEGWLVGRITGETKFSGEEAGKERKSVVGTMGDG